MNQSDRERVADGVWHRACEVAQVYADFYSELESYSTLCQTALAYAFADGLRTYGDARAAEERAAREGAERECARLSQQCGELMIALHDAIRRPLGVVPASAEPFYSHQLADEAEQRRPRGDHLDQV